MCPKIEILIYHLMNGIDEFFWRNGSSQSERTVKVMVARGCAISFCFNVGGEANGLSTSCSRRDLDLVTNVFF